jgi:hypothetical protein
MKAKLPDRSPITPHTSLRLRIAAEVAFPDGSMGVSGLRRQARAGRLVIERVGNRDYPTLEKRVPSAIVKNSCRPRRLKSLADEQLQRLQPPKANRPGDETPPSSVELISKLYLYWVRPAGRA